MKRLHRPSSDLNTPSEEDEDSSRSTCESLQELTGLIPVGAAHLYSFLADLKASEHPQKYIFSVVSPLYVCTLKVLKVNRRRRSSFYPLRYKKHKISSFPSVLTSSRSGRLFVFTLFLHFYLRVC